MRLEEGIKLEFKDVLFRPKRSTLSSRAQVSLEIKHRYRNSKREWTGVPLVAANMDTVGTFEMAIAFSKRKCLVCLHKHYTVEETKAFADANPDVLPFVAVSTGTSAKDVAKLKATLEAVPGIALICMDVANGYSEHFSAAVRAVRAAHPAHTIIAGNVVTGEMVEQLLLDGADIIKVGIGPGSVCTTRKQTGVGYPQLSAVIECADAAHGMGGHVMADGGCTCPGDIAKAFGAGADFVMCGGMFSGHEQSGGELVEKNGRHFKRFYGMSSAVAMKKYAGGVAKYRASEGKCVEVPFRGDVDGTITEILGGVRSTCTYVGSPTLKSLSKCTTFIRCSQQLNTVFNTLAHKDVAPGLRDSAVKTKAPGGGGGADASAAAAADAEAPPAKKR